MSADSLQAQRNRGVGWRARNWGVARFESWRARQGFCLESRTCVVAGPAPRPVARSASPEADRQLLHRKEEEARVVHWVGEWLLQFDLVQTLEQQLERGRELNGSSTLPTLSSVRSWVSDSSTGRSRGPTAARSMNRPLLKMPSNKALQPTG